MDLSQIVTWLTSSSQNMGMVAIAGIALFMAWRDGWIGAKPTDTLTAKTAPTSEEAFKAVNVLVRYYEEEQCAEGIDAAKRCGQHLWHSHDATPVARPTTGGVT